MTAKKNIKLNDATAEAEVTTEVISASKKPKVYKVAAGLTLTSKRGILVSGEIVSDRDFVGESDTFKQLIEKKAVV
jgi:hypothetical protein